MGNARQEEGAGTNRRTQTIRASQGVRGQGREGPVRGQRLPGSVHSTRRHGRGRRTAVHHEHNTHRAREQWHRRGGRQVRGAGSGASGGKAQGSDTMPCVQQDVPQAEAKPVASRGGRAAAASSEGVRGAWAGGDEGRAGPHAGRLSPPAPLTDVLGGISRVVITLVSGESGDGPAGRASGGRAAGKKRGRGRVGRRQGRASRGEWRDYGGGGSRS